MDVPVIELALEEIVGDIRKGDAEIERVSAEIERMNAEIERMNAEINRIRQHKTRLEAIATCLSPLLNKPEVAAEATEVACSTEQVAELAYKYWAERGYTDGGNEDDWRRAEQELRAKAHTAPVVVFELLGTK